MAKVGSITVEIKPTVTLESAVACVIMLNLFLAENEEYRLKLADGKWHLTDEPLVPTSGGIYDGYLSALSNIPNPGSPSNMTEDELMSIAKEIEQAFKVNPERMA